MGAEGAVNIILRKQIEAAEDPDAKRAELVGEFRKIIDPYIAAGNDMIDDIIDPRETRAVVIKGLEMAATKHVERPKKRHGVMPV
jgi:acetyl-CoA carboxylase carboxyltransferase component